jgi:outer membrane protein assembly factor BamB
LLGTGGNLFCLAMADGKTIWQKNVLSLYKSPSGYFGSGSSPIVIGERLLLNVGGQDAGVVAFDINSGDEIWKAFDDRASYSSPIEVSIDSQKTAVFVTRMHLVGIDPTDGKVLFKTSFGKRGPTVNGAMPVFANGNLFINSAYGGSRRFQKRFVPLCGGRIWQSDVVASWRRGRAHTENRRQVGGAGQRRDAFGSSTR